MSLPKNIHRMKIILFIVPIVFFLIFLCIKLTLPDVYTASIQEDAVLENAQTVLYLISSIGAFLLSIKFLRNTMTLVGILYCILGVGLLFVSIEEISWGQRLFHIVTPAYFIKHNFQNEISIHNLVTVQGILHRLYITVGAYGAFAWALTLLILPKVKAHWYHTVNYVVPDWFLSSYFFFTFFIYTLLEYVSPPYPGSFLVWRDQEPMELLLSLGFLLFIVARYIRLNMYLKTARRD